MASLRSRRSVLRLCGTVGLGAGLAGCLGDGGETPEQAVTSPDSADAAVVVYWFWGDGCPVCDDQKGFIDEIAATSETDVVALEVYNDAENRELFHDVIDEYNIQREAVPTTVIGSEHWIGDSSDIRDAIQAKVSDCREESGCQPSAVV
ncbi:glutaredoxin family protein [Natranaeroarchaeum aerophilus]|uniref:Thioredoxin family protein n=1 Tax=Natranaeroarchaeum aerophilus TaxID=2917711 RepID=A0AAE3FSF4_9EURY|nr:thioredoxin family protein [Natranaeroarchaeum aerophilus]MCL9814464.1 thioredoxin family protein [Natranaeroarchaeum aerophilus]